MKKTLTVTMPDRSRWSIPVAIIAQHRAAHFAMRLFDGDVERSLKEDTLPLFQNNPYAIERWSEEMMDWDDVKDHAQQIAPTNVNFHEGWQQGMKVLA
ncbi:MAG: hypothetical protein HQL84_09150 [Magnetococcales bacterium]|nr:hypothetical protein [Magnetococcales bacterium]MBF0150198.1 hypothetical protein [Magnetococcales bacterium]MBF0174790.1 hypothetical protein [Magnetococcales bacterium]MBF0347914.1 hypothetical protein [Magnetococcales bacterium]MBF0631908.1 hypothetical protein [Magnetococcales bacterium]